MKMLYQASRWLVPALLFCVACAQNPEEPGDIVEPSGNDLIVCEIDETPTLEDALATKTTLSASHVPLWSSSDAISVFSSEGSSARFALIEGEGTARGTFRGTLPQSSTYTALYSADANATMSGGAVRFTQPQVQTAATGDFAAGANPMVATFTAQNPTPAFKNIFSLLELRLTGTSKVSKMELESLSNSEMLWGDCTLSINGAQGTNSQTLSIANGSNKVILNFASAVQLSEGTASSFFFVLPAGTLASGFSLNVYDENNSIVSHTVANQSYDNQALKRSRIKLMAALTGIDRANDGNILPEPFTWAAYNNLRRSGTEYETNIDPQTSGYPQPREKYVGTFYFIWHTANSVGGGPYDIQKLLGAGNYNVNESAVASSRGKTCHWGEPYLGYYRDDDLWVLRKHAQMLSDAGVDFIAFDVTNNAFYLGEITKLCNLWLQMKAEGYNPPKITFMIWHSKADGSTSNYDEFNHNNAVCYLYQNFYANPAYNDLWFRWQGKPLMMALGHQVTNTTVKNYFTFRPTWYLWNNQAQTRSDVGDPWYYQYGGPNGKWPWAVAYTDDTTDPMRAGTYNGVNEFCPVSPATHPVSNIGRSYPINQGIRYNSGANSYVKQPEKGIYFRSQFNAANALDPQIMFYTGWNEFLMGHFGPGTLEFYYCGGERSQTSLFVDQFNNEFSRDIEPIAGDFGDNYYYYMADYIRRFKGVANLPTYSTFKSISIDGYFTDWNSVNSVYADDKYDTKWRGYDNNNGNNGWPAYGGSLANYYNRTGRNDLYKSKIATDGTNLFFYMESMDNLTGYTGNEDGLKLLITAGSGSKWEGFNYMLKPTSATTATLYRVNGTTYSWTVVSNAISISVSGNKLEASIPLSSLGIGSSSFTVDFKWVDNVDLSASDGIQRCMRDGDSAPNGRFRYRYIFSR